MSHHVECIDCTSYDVCSFDTYYFDDFNFEIWVENGKIDTVKCQKECYWQGKDLINMLYDDFFCWQDKFQMTKICCMCLLVPGIADKIKRFTPLMIWE